MFNGFCENAVGVFDNNRVYLNTGVLMEIACCVPKDW